MDLVELAKEQGLFQALRSQLQHFLESYPLFVLVPLDLAGLPESTGQFITGLILHHLTPLHHFGSGQPNYRFLAYSLDCWPSALQPHSLDC